MRRGITLPELVIALGILTLLFSIATISLLRSHRSSVQKALVDSLTTDLRDQQTKAMSQNTEGAPASLDYGVYLSETSYTLFHGSVYNQSEPTNFVINLDPSLRFTNITFPSSVIVFKAGSGEVSNYNSSTASFSVEDLTNDEIIPITLNVYGVTFD